MFSNGRATVRAIVLAIVLAIVRAIVLATVRIELVRDRHQSRLSVAELVRVDPKGRSSAIRNIWAP